ncbi:MAG TPA: glycerophosphodiester phosphodiesterase [Kofleriaceae bacterium]|nr:glycerophosphodiester phosphodiesterase [Kofleriaceae bacterium]
MRLLPLPHIGRTGRATRWRRVRGRPRVFGHRGAPVHAPENTLLSFERALAAGADGIELDVRFDGDRNVVVFHDDELSRLTGRPGRMDALPAAERAALRVRGEPVPLLAEVLAAFDTDVNVEIKSPRLGRAGDLVAAVAGVIKQSGRAERVLVSSFDPVALVQLYRHLPDVAVAHLFHDQQSLALRRGWAGHLVGASLVHPQHTLVDATSLARWHRVGFAVNVWTVNDDAELRRLAALGVDGVFADDPGHALAVLAGE